MKKYVIYLITVAFALSAVFTACKKDKEAKDVPVTGEEKGVVINGVRWATRNLDVGGVFVAKPEDYGALFQWGRRADGHESRTSLAYPTNDNSYENGVVNVSELDAYGQIPTTHAAYSKFVKQDAEPWDWRTPYDDALWNSGTESTPMKTTNDPSPAGWRVPTREELESLADETYVTRKWTTQNGINGYRFTDKASGNFLFLPAADSRFCSNGSLDDTGLSGNYWSSTSADFLRFFGGIFRVGYGSSQAHGCSVRCVAEKSEL